MKVTTYRDPLQLAIDIAMQRKKALILWEMERKKKTVFDIYCAIRIPQNEISEELIELVEMGLVARILHVRKKDKFVEYALTNRGAMLLKCLRKMMNVGIEIMMDYRMNDFLEAEGYIEKVEISEECEVQEETANV